LTHLVVIFFVYMLGSKVIFNPLDEQSYVVCPYLLQILLKNTWSARKKFPILKIL